MTGTWKLVRITLRRDRWLLPVWAVVPALFPLVFVSAFTTAYPSDQALRAYAETSTHSTAFTFSYGALHGSTLGELIAWRSGFIPVVIAVCTLLTVIRHTRTEEEAGRAELLGATPVGRHAGLAAGLIVACAGSLVCGLLTALGLMGSGLATSGSLAQGLGLALAGCVFAAVGAVVAQLTTGAGGARGIAFVVLGAAFLLRGIGDVSAQSGGALGWVSWLSPVGWTGELHAFSGERWWVLAVGAVAIAALAWMATWLSGRRDLGAGLLPDRLGPAAAAPGLRSPMALAWRLHRGALFSRTAGYVVVGLGLGAIASSIGQLMDNSTPAAREVLARLGGPGTIVDQYTVAMMTMFAVISAGLAVQSTLRLRVEERDGRAEPLLALPVGRMPWALSHVVFAILGPAVGLAAFGIAMGLGHGLVTGDVGGQLPRILGAALAQLPAAWVFAGLALALFGLLPQFSVAAFAVMGLNLLLGWIGLELQLGDWIVNLSVFGHIPQLPGGEMRMLPLVLMTGAAVLLGLVGLYGLRRRDAPA